MKYRPGDIISLDKNTECMTLVYGFFGSSYKTVDFFGAFVKEYRDPFINIDQSPTLLITDIFREE